PSKTTKIAILLCLCGLLCSLGPSTCTIPFILGEMPLASPVSSLTSDTAPLPSPINSLDRDSSKCFLISAPFQIQGRIVGFVLFSRKSLYPINCAGELSIIRYPLLIDYLETFIYITLTPRLIICQI